MLSAESGICCEGSRAVSEIRDPKDVAVAALRELVKIKGCYGTHAMQRDRAWAAAKAALAALDANAAVVAADAPTDNEYLILSLKWTKATDRSLTWWRKGGGYCLELYVAERFNLETAKYHCSSSPKRNVPIRADIAYGVGATQVSFDDLGKLGITTDQLIAAENS